jgi:hypothetical protein
VHNMEQNAGVCELLRLFRRKYVVRGRGKRMVGDIPGAT